MTPADMADSSASSEQRLAALFRRAQAEGALGTWPVDEVIAHARDFVTALPQTTSTVLDLGSGAGVPGLVIALDRPMLRVTLVDRRAKRIDALHRSIAALGWTARVAALEAEADALIQDPLHQGAYDAVVARGFGPPTTTLRAATRLARVGGCIIISEPPAGQPSRWEPSLLAEYGVSIPVCFGRVVRFHVEHSN